MRRHKRILALSVSAGLAVSATASAQFTIVSNQPGNFTDIAATGTVITSGDDSSVAFTSSVTNALVTSPNLFGSTNGNVTASAFATFTNSPLPVTGLTLGLFAFWDDLFVDPPTGTFIHQGVVEGGVNVEVIQWNNVRTYATPTGGRGLFQIKIFATGPILVQYIYRDVSFTGTASTNGASATVGVQWGASSFHQHSFNTPSLSDGAILSVVFEGPTGACCLPSGVCTVNTANTCAAQGGIYRGDGTTCPANCPQPPTGACCLPNLTCVVTWQGSCTAQGGTYRGDNSVCAGNCPQAWAEQGDAGDLPASAQIVAGSGDLPGIAGGLGETTDADMYRIQICDAANFAANTLGPTTAFADTQLFVFDTTGHGVTHNDDDPQGTGGFRSRLSGQFIPGNGEYFLAVSGYNKDPHGDQTTGLIWINTPFNVERRPDGPAAGEAAGSWDSGGAYTGAYTIFLTGSCYISQGPACYADCNGDHALNVNDFVCFQGLFAAGNLLADCNHDTALNVLDFVCFQSAFAAGCSAP